MDQFRKDLKRLFAEVDRSNRETDELLARLDAKKRALVKKDLSVGIRHKTVASEKTKGTSFILSDATIDRYGDSILSEGWQLANFKKNPIALFAHSGSFPIGKWRDVRIEDNALRGTLELAPKGSSSRIDELHALIDADILRAVSVGFSPIEYEERKGDEYGIIYKKQELVECSLVSVPANPSALVVAKKLNISDETQEMVFGSRATDGRERERPTRLPALLAGPMDAESEKAWNTWSDRKIKRAFDTYIEVVHNKLVKDIDTQNNGFIGDVQKAFNSWADGLRKEWRKEITDLKKDLEIAELNREVARLKRGQKR